MFYVIITSNVIIVMRQKFRFLLSVIFSLRDKMEGKGDTSEGGANFLLVKQRFKRHDVLRFYSRKVFPGKF